MPKSKVRKKVADHQAHEEQVHAVEAPYKESPRWLAPVMVANFLIGLLWIVIFYIAAPAASRPIPGINTWNMVVGFSFIAIGFSLATKWK